MWDTLDRLFSGRFMPHGHCYLWTPSMVWLQVISNLLIAVAYLSISATLYYIVRKIKDIPFSWMYIAFGVFIITCGGTHAVDIITIWHPIYWFDGGLRAVTAIASVGTAVLLFPLIPKAVGLADAAQLAHERGLKLETTFQELAEAHAKTKELESLKTAFFANVSHELRTPLALILGPAEKLLAAPDLPAAHRADIQVLARNARTLLKHVNDLLDVSKLEAGRMDLVWTHADLAALVRAVASHFEALAATRSITFDVTAPASLPAHLDRDKIHRAVLNIVANAFKFVPDGGAIHVTLEALAAKNGVDRARITISDTGPGVAPKFRETIFDRFAQADTSTTRGFGGTGLGLAITKDFVELHGGTVSVGDATSRGGGRNVGACFTVDLPLRAPEGTVIGTAVNTQIDALAAQAVEELQPPLPPSSSAADTSRPIVLVVEDNREMNAFLASTLAKSYRVESAFDGAEGMTKARDLSPDLVITDVMMPKMSGEELLKAMRLEPTLESVPVLVLTAKADDDLRVGLLREGAQDYLNKPFHAEELLARAGNLVAMKRARDVLRRELVSQMEDVGLLAGELGARSRELAGALETVRGAREQAERASHLKTSFLGMVSHELRAPLTSIQLLQDRLSAGSELTTRDRSIVDRMGRSTSRMTELVDSLLEYARIASGRMETHMERVDLAEIVRSAAEVLKPQTDRKSLTLTIEGPDFAAIDSDSRLVRLVVTNLMSNAVKFTEKGSVTASITRRDASFVVKIRDTGAGIPAHELARIFEPFQQLEPVRNKHLPGVGLGLSLVREIVENLRGQIDVESDVGKGSTFQVTFPAVAPN